MNASRNVCVRVIVCAHIGSNGDHCTQCTATAVYNTRASALRSYNPMTHIPPAAELQTALPSKFPAHPTTPPPVLPSPANSTTPLPVLFHSSACDMRQIYWWKRTHHDKPSRA